MYCSLSFIDIQAGFTGQGVLGRKSARIGVQAKLPKHPKRSTT